MTFHYNPDLLSDEALRRQFVVRGDVLERLVSALRAERPGHHLVVGPRGMGKTTLLRRLHLSLRDEADLAARWIPLAFPEEQYNVSRLPDFWANCVDALADSLERMGRKEDAARLDQAMDRGAHGAFEALLDVCEREHRGLVLLVDNLDLVLGRLGEADQWELRRVLGSTPSLVLVGASANLADESAEYGKPFYEFLLPVQLGPLTLPEMRAVLDVLAREAGAEVAASIAAVPAGRLRSLHTLTGGNPRTTGLIFEVLCQDTHADAETLLNGLLDRVTPLYKARFEALPDQLQVVLDAVALAWDPASAATIATATGLGVNLASAQLARLVELGHVEKVPLPGTRKHGFQVAERFFNIWYLMRASRRLRRRLGHLVRFMELLWMPEDRRLIASAFIRDGAELGATLALAQTEGAAAEPAMAAAVARALAEVEENAEALREKLAEMIEPEPRSLLVRDAVDREAWRRELRAKLRARAGELEEAGLRVDEVEEAGLVLRSLAGFAWDADGSMREIGELTRKLRELRESYVQLGGERLASVLLDAAVSPGWNGPLDRRGQAAAVLARPSPWLELAIRLALLSVEDEKHAFAALSERALIEVTREAFECRDAMALRLVHRVRRVREEAAPAVLGMYNECTDPPDWVAATSAYVAAGDLPSALRTARGLVATSPDNPLGWEVLAFGSDDPGERRRAVDEGLRHCPDALDLTAKALELTMAEGEWDAAGRYAARLHQWPLSEYAASWVCLSYVFHPRAHAIALIQAAIEAGEASDPGQRRLVEVSAILGLDPDVAIRRFLRGLRGARRRERKSTLEKVAGDALRSLDVATPVAPRLLALDALWAPASRGNLADALSINGLLLLLAAGGHTREARDWIDARGQAEVLAPLVHALRIREAGDPGLLDGLSPEMRAPVQELLTRIEELRASGGIRPVPNETFSLAWAAERARLASSG